MRRIGGSCLQVLVTNAVSVDQWLYQFKLWTTIQDENLGRFTSSAKEWFSMPAGVMICTYSMIAGSFRRSAESQRIFDAITGREWGLILLDEVHVVPAEMFRCVQGLAIANLSS
jgi:DNA excision repair protein ERCC-3